MACNFDARPNPDDIFDDDDSDLCTVHNSYRAWSGETTCLYAGGKRKKASYDEAGFDVAASLRERRENRS